ncbi:hypothetical protein [Ferrimonas kyonanensis]|uniref:hypothetical protein n=1 Tax=Ferrimonas kyonanensis TaxID=364763 RepID=UPI000488BB6D|nr:hypothetical protein [Ferrimonas kyonanensis]
MPLVEVEPGISKSMDAKNKEAIYPKIKGVVVVNGDGSLTPMNDEKYWNHLGGAFRKKVDAYCLLYNHGIRIVNKPC